MTSKRWLQIYVILYFSLFLEPDRETGQFCRTIRLPGSAKLDRVCWINILYAPEDMLKERLNSEGYKTITPRIPLEGAVLALLHPSCSDNPLSRSNGSLDNFGVSIHFKYPDCWLMALRSIILQGPEESLMSKMITNKS